MDLRTALARATIGRWAFVAFNLVLVLTGLAISLSMAEKLRDFFTTEKVLEDMADGFGTILIGYGVLLEERDALMRILKLYPRYAGPAEERVDQLCHVYGLFLLLLGLFAEIPVQLILIPNDTINTEGLEPYLFGVSLTFIVVALVVLLRFTEQLLRRSRAVVQVAPAAD
jgi:hypothetical protein